MDEIEYKLNTKNSVLVVNAIDKLITAIKSAIKPGEKQNLLIDNKELHFLREKCLSKDSMVSLTACQGLLALVELGVLEIADTVSTVVSLLPSASNYSAIISTLAGLLILDLKSRFVPGEVYKCPFSFKAMQHPFITVLEKNKDAEDYVLAQMQALCTHPDYIISSNSLELLRPVFLWLTCNPKHHCSSIRPWQLLLSLRQKWAQSLLFACISCQQICNPDRIERAFAAYSAVTDTLIYQQHREYVMAILPILARISNELNKHGRDPRACYNLIERCFSLEAPELRWVAGLTVTLLADNLTNSSALYLHELFNLCLNIITKYEYSKLSLSIFAALSLQWLHLPSYLTSSALRIASKILDMYQSPKEDTGLHMPNLKSNRTFQSFLFTDYRLSIIFRINQTWERVRDNLEKLENWFDRLESVDDTLKLELVSFFIGVLMERRKEEWYSRIALRALAVVVRLVEVRKEVSVMLLPVLLYKMANDVSPEVKLECLKALPLMAKTKENVPTIVSVLNKMKTNKGAPTSLLISLYTSLAETQVRCFPYLQELLMETALKQDELKWETDIAKAMAVKRICEIRASTHGLELVPVISSILNRCTDKPGALATSIALEALLVLWRDNAVAPPSTWRVLEPKLGKDGRRTVQISVCRLLGAAPAPGLRVAAPDYTQLVSDAARKLWTYVADSNHPDVVEAACDALSQYKLDDYKLKDIPEVYRKKVKLPSSYCKTPADAARKPEEVLEYVPCEVWPEVFKYTNQAALAGVQRLATKLIEREVKGYRSGVYQETRCEPQNLNHLPATSVYKGLMECFREQAEWPSYEIPNEVLESILKTLAAEYPKPLPTIDLRFLQSLLNKSSRWHSGCLQLAARQAQISQSAKAILEKYLQEIDPEVTKDVEILIFFEVLPILCRGMPPNSLRPPIEKCLNHSFLAVPNSKSKKFEKEQLQELLFIKQLEMIKVCLESERIHEANRTLLSQILENYFSLISDDNVAWPTYVEACKCLSTKYLERMSSPSSWWEVSAGLMRKACAVRSAVAAGAGCGSPLVWLNELVEAQATQIVDQESSLETMTSALLAAKPDDPSTKEWFLQLMARAQITFNESGDKSSKLYMFDVFALSAIIFSGQWALEPDVGVGVGGGRVWRRGALPPALAALLARDAWADCAPKMLEWLSHTRLVSQDILTRACCQRCIIALRHSEYFGVYRIWSRLVLYLGLDIIEECI